MSEEPKSTAGQPQVSTKVESTENPKITKAVKVKNPKRVEAGKKLAAVSKAAKEKKARERLQAEIDENSWKIDYGTIFGLVGFTVAVGTVWYASRGVKETPKPEVKNMETQNAVKETPKVQERATTTLASLD